MAESQAASFEFSARPIIRSRREAVGRIGKKRLGFERREHFLCVLFPVGGHVQDAAGTQPQCQLPHERRLQETPLVVPFLGPRVRKKNVHTRKGRGPDHGRDDFHGVVPDDSEIGKLKRGSMFEKAAHAGRVYLDTQKIGIAPRVRDGRRGLAHAAPDLDHDIGLPAKRRSSIERL